MELCMFFKKLVLLTCLFTTALQAEIRHIIWDAGFTLTAVDKKRMAFEMLKSPKTVWAMLRYGATPARMRQWMFDVLMQYNGPQPAETPERKHLKDEQGTALPQFMAYTWFCTQKSTEEILELINQAVGQWDPGYLVPIAKRDLVRTMMHIAFGKLGNNTKAIPAAVALVKKYQKEGFKQYILSNFSREEFEIMQKTPVNQELFSFIPNEHIVTSGHCGFAKPHYAIFEYFLEKYHVQPHECVFIDDQIENVRAARACGIHAIHLQKGNYLQVQEELDDMLCLSELTNA